MDRQTLDQLNNTLINPNGPEGKISAEKHREMNVALSEYAEHVVDEALNGWTRDYAYESYGDKLLKKVTGYSGGTGVAPTLHIGEYYTATSGFTSNKDLAADFRGIPGSGVKLPLYSKIKTGPITAGTQFIDDENGNTIYIVQTGQTLNPGELPAASSKVKALSDPGYFNLIKSDFVAGLGTPEVTKVNNTLYIRWLVNTGEALKIPNILVSGKTYLVAFRARVSHHSAAIKLAVGSSYTSTPNASVVHSDNITDFAETRWRILEFTANGPDFWIGKIPIPLYNFSTAIEEIILVEKTELRKAILENATKSHITGAKLIADEDRTLVRLYGWANTVGTPANVNNGKLNLNFNSGANECTAVQYLSSLILTGKKIKVSLTAKLVSGTGETVLTVGRFAGTSTGDKGPYHFKIKPTVTETTYTGEIFVEPSGAVATQLAIGALSAENKGGKYEIDNIEVTLALNSVIISKDYSNIIYNNALGVFPNINPNIPHSEIKLIGDSLLANSIGGTIPNVETITRRPFRLTSANNVARRLYDKYCINKPNWRRIDDADWSTVSGAWSTSTGHFEPAHTGDAYYTTASASAAKELNVPDGDEWLVIIFKEANNLGTLYFQINGLAVTADQGAASYNCNYSNVGATGNPYKKLLFKLPAGTGRKFKVIKDATAAAVHIWGSYSWAGSTVIFTPIAHGGHTLNELYVQHYQDEYLRNKDFTNGVIFEVTEMNDTRTANVAAVVSELSAWYDRLKDKDVLFTTCNILGTDPTDGTPNYYLTTQGNGFTQKQMNDEVKKFLIDKGAPFIDLFTIFERATIAKGGTLEGGDAGIYWTHDGQHGSPEGVLLWFQSLTAALNTSPFISINK